MALAFWKRKPKQENSSGLEQVVQVESSQPFSCNELGLLYPYSLDPKTDADFYWQSLEQEGLADLIDQCYVLPWEELYRLIGDEEHEGAIHLLQLPNSTNLRPMIRSEGALSDSDFKIILSGWCDASGVKSTASIQREGAVIQVDQQPFLLTQQRWELVEKVREFARLGSSKTRQDNERYWGRIRRLAQQSNTVMDDFLRKTVVLAPETLQLNMRRNDSLNESVVEIQPAFDDAPDGWLNTFDKYNNVQGRYDITLPDGGIVHVVVDEQVKDVLKEIKSMPARRVVGKRAEKFLKNPYVQLGESAAAVVSPESFEQSKKVAEIYSYDLTIKSEYDAQGFFQSASLLLDASTEKEKPTIMLELQNPDHASYLTDGYAKACLSDEDSFYWAGYEILLSPAATQQIEQLRSDLQGLLQQKDAALVQSILDVNAYGERVFGIGMPPPGSVANGASGETWMPVSRQGQLFEKIKPYISNEVLRDIQAAIATSDQSENKLVELSYLDRPVTMADAKDIEYRVAEHLRQQQEDEPAKDDKPEVEKAVPSVLLIKSNIDDDEFITKRGESLKFDHLNARPYLPKSFRSAEFQVKPYQKVGIAWLQNLQKHTPDLVNGCLLADDMGLGKTLQLLSFIGAYLERAKDKKPVLIVAPVSLLENWDAEAKKFFSDQFGKILSLYGEHVKSRKLQHVPEDLAQQGIKNLLAPNWRGDADIVLTTYETLRDLQFSLGREHWGIMVCDEAQKIKTPNTLVTQAAKAMNVDFKIACTGTPVENSLVDLWCLFDFIQPGLLGSLKEFGQAYRRPIEDDEDAVGLQKLKDLIEPQTLRRMKVDVAELKAKIEVDNCKQIPISRLQRQQYEKVIAEYELVSDEGRGRAILGALHTMRTICAHPLELDPRQPRAESPKVEWLITTLQEIQRKQEKVIIFTELRIIQTFLQKLLKEVFGLQVYTVNGATASSSKKGETRQQLIDKFQKSDGFNVIVMSPVAVGFGVNVQQANHVIHYTRCWNPAKEDQATDRAYRIGQQKEVFVYYPSIHADDFETFEIKLDRLLDGKRQLATDMLRPANDINIGGLAEGILGSVSEDDYTADWSSISEMIRSERGWQCESCHIRLERSDLKRFLHVHHINAKKSDNRSENLRALCVRCHAEQPGHDHMRNGSDYFKFMSLVG